MVIIIIKAGVSMAIMLFQILVCLLVIAVGMVAYGIARLVYVLMLSYSWTSSPIQQITKATDASKGTLEKS